METNISYTPIGIIKTPHLKIDGMPVQPSGARDVEGQIIVNMEFAAGLADLDGFSHIILLYHLHRVTAYKLFVVPFLDDKPHGIFATRAPVRPNPIGISIVRLKAVENNILQVLDVDMLNDTPLLDIKPFYPDYDNQFGVRCGWLEAKKEVNIEQLKSDDRFKNECGHKNRCINKS